MKKIFALLSFLAMPGAMVLAQMDNVVVVEDTYTPTVKDSKKIDVLPKAEESKTTHYKVEYSNKTMPTASYPDEATETDSLGERSKNNFIAIGGGTHGQLLGKAHVMYERNENLPDFYNVFFSGFNGKVSNQASSLDKWKSRFYSLNAQLEINQKIIDDCTLTASAGWESRVFNYQPTLLSPQPSVITPLTDKQHENFANVEAELSELTFGKYTLEAYLGFMLYKQKYVTTLEDEIDEKIIEAELDNRFDISDNHSVGLDICYGRQWYNNARIDNVWCTDFMPHYNFSNDQWDIQLGAYICTTFSESPSIAPDCSIAFHLDRNTDIYAEASGGETGPYLRDIARLHPYWAYAAPGEDDDNLCPDSEWDALKAKVGVRFSPVKNLTVDINGGYEIQDNRIEFITDDMGSTNHYVQAEYGDGKHTYLNLDVAYKYGNLLDITLCNQYNKWTTNIFDDEDGVSEDGRELTWRPELNLCWNASINILKGLKLGIDWQLQTFGKDKYYERPVTCDLRASLTYTFGNRISVFAKGQNLLSQDYDRMLQYRALPASAIIGIAATF